MTLDISTQLLPANPITLLILMMIHWTLLVLKSDNVYTKEDCVGFDLKAFEKNSDALTFDMDNGDFLWEEAILSLPAVNATANVNTGSFEKDGQLYTDNNVTGCELPKFINCYNGSMYQSIKDIGVDDGVPTHNKIWVQSSEDESSKSIDAMNVEKDSDESDVLEALKSKLGGDLQKNAGLYPSEDPRLDGLNQEVLSGQYLVHEFWDDDSLKITELKLDLEACASFPAETASNKDASKQGEPDFTSKDGAGPHDTVVKKGNNISLDKEDNVVVQEPTTGVTPSKLQTDHGEGKAKFGKSLNEEKTSPESPEHVAVQESAHNSDSNKMTHPEALLLKSTLQQILIPQSKIHKTLKLQNYLLLKLWQDMKKAHLAIQWWVPQN